VNKENGFRYLAIFFFAFTLLLTACAPQRSSLRNQIVGIWRYRGSNQLTLEANGKFLDQWKRVDGDEEDSGTWKFTDGLLTMKTKHIYMHYNPKATNIGPVNRDRGAECYRLTVLDSSHLMVVNDWLPFKTNLLERKK